MDMCRLVCLVFLIELLSLLMLYIARFLFTHCDYCATVIVQGNGILMLCRVFLQLRELLHTRNYFCVEPCQRQSFGAEAARGIGDRLVHAWCFKAFLFNWDSTPITISGELQRL